MSEIIFLQTFDVIEVNKRVIEEFGGIHGIRDRGLLESALSNPRNLYFYKDANFYEIATSYAFAIIQNHAFLDGNKRTGFACMTIFLMQNNINATFDVEEAVTMMVQIATKQAAFEKVVKWLNNAKL